MLTGLADVSILLGRVGISYSIGRIGAYTPLILVLDPIAMRFVFVHECRATLGICRDGWQPLA